MKPSKKTTAAPVFECKFCSYTSPKERGVRMHTMKKHPAAGKTAASRKESKDIKAAIANATETMVYPETSQTPPPAASSVQPPQPESIPPLSPAEIEADDIKKSILEAQAGMVYPESVPETEPAIADVINRQATEQDALSNIARYIREKGTTSMKREVLLSLGVPESAIPETGGLMFKNRYLIRRVTQGHDLLSVEQP